jgi:hypothetical protein
MLCRFLTRACVAVLAAQGLPKLNFIAQYADNSRRNLIALAIDCYNSVQKRVRIPFAFQNTKD